MRPNAKDDVDIAAEQEELARQEALWQFTRKQKAVTRTTGYCNNCDAPSDKTFCDADCRRDWERRQLKKERQ